jgi:hypothetical protein
VPEAGDHPDEGAHLRDHLRDGDKDRPGHAAAEGLLPVDHHQGGQQRDGHREGDHADRGGQVERSRRQERLHQVHADDDQPAVDQVELPESFLDLLHVLVHVTVLSARGSPASGWLEARLEASRDAARPPVAHP